MPMIGGTSDEAYITNVRSQGSQLSGGSSKVKKSKGMLKSPDRSGDGRDYKKVTPVTSEGVPRQSKRLSKKAVVEDSSDTESVES